MYLESRGLAANTINQQLAAVRSLFARIRRRRFAHPELTSGISRVKGVKQLGVSRRQLVERNAKLRSPATC
jgi:hypothetical protein